ncbi:hypothetical protein [Roseibium sp.]|uniref:hypothetical protein n=1 Tax=Roseibium sp. TaxID=1936156 RepID=UPI003BABCEA1
MAKPLRSRLIKYASNNWFRSSILILGILDSSVSAGQTIHSSTCPVSWLSIVEKVASVRSKLPAGKNVVLFSGPDGEVYNCLDEAIPDQDLEQIRFFKKSLAQAMAQNRLDRPGTETGYCDYGSYPDERSSVQYMFNLPYDAAELYSDPCAGRLEIYLRSLSEKAQPHSSKHSSPE